MTDLPTGFLNESANMPFALVSRISSIVRSLKEGHTKSTCDPIDGLSPRLVVALSHVVIFQPISVSDLALRLNVSLATASQTVSQLSTLDFVQRKEDPVDHRRTLVSLSPTKGTQAAAHLHEKLGPIADAINEMGVENFELLCELLDKIIMRLERTEDVEKVQRA